MPTTATRTVRGEGGSPDRTVIAWKDDVRGEILTQVLVEHDPSGAVLVLHKDKTGNIREIARFDALA